MEDRGLTMTRAVKVWEGDAELTEITLVKKSKTVWVAVGNYVGKRIEVQGRSANSATALSRDAAHYRSN
jgi:hypothetical protein